MSVTTRTADSLSDDDIIKCLETNVDIKNDEGYKTWIGGGLQDEDYNSVDGSFTYTLLNADSYSNPIQVNDGYVTAYGSKAGTYTVEIKG
ncbi:MAG: hypothetical protein LUI02_03765, partial [Clostridiales bacterium]|nr:hypothetical protein [Clostridiales bacterium]